MFGLEIEFSKIHDVDPSVKSYDGINIVYYNHPLFTIGSDAPNFEARSIILTNMDQVKEIVRTIKQLGCNIEEKKHTCGLHVHVDRGVYSRKELRKSLKKFWNKNYDSIFTEFRPLPSRYGFIRARDGFNPHSIIYIHHVYNTIEFRLFDSKLDTEYVIHCVRRSKQWAREILSNAN